MSEIQLSEDLRDGIQEIANIAVGQAADRVARSFSTFVKLPIPNVHLIEAVDISMALGAIDSGQSVTAVTQPFIGSGISGEALLLFTDASMAELSGLMGHVDLDISREHEQAELVLEIASLLNGSCIQGFCSQLDIDVLLKHPKILARHTSLSALLADNTFPWHHALTIELNYAFEGYEITCDLLILFHEEAINTLFEKVDLLLS